MSAGSLRRPLQQSLLFLAAATAIGLLGCDQANQPVEPSPTCTFAISPAAQTFENDAGTATVVVTGSAPSCAWTVTSSASWLTILEGATGSGAGLVKYAISANPSTETRTAVVTIGGGTHEVTQHGRTATVCTYTITPASATIPSDGGAGSVAVTAPATCAWTATTNAAWIVITSGSPGSGSGTVGYTVARNGDTAARGAVVTIADQTLAVAQLGQAQPLICEYSITPVDFSPCMPGGTQNIVMSTQATCPWSATANAAWLTVTAASSGSGPGVIRFSYSDNYDAPRDGQVLVRWPTPTAGQNVRVAQAGCRYGVSKTTISFGPVGGSGTFDVVQESDPNTCGGALQDRCIWTATSSAPWITITSSMPRMGDNPVAFTVAANDSTTARTGTIVVKDQVVQITQAGK